MDRAKPFDIPKREVWEAYKRVRANKGTAGVDGQWIADFEANPSNNSTSSGTECRRAVTIRRRCEG